MTDLPHAYADLPRFAFGDSPELADELGHLVVTGRKTATCYLPSTFYDKGEQLPVRGRRDVVLDGGARPLCVIETKEVVVQPAGKVDAAFAYDEGEGDRSLAYWWAAHATFFGRNGVTLTPDTMLVCERFVVVHRFPIPSSADEARPDAR